MTLPLQPTTISSTPLTGTLNYDVLTQTVYYSNVAATGNFQVNFRGDSVTSFASVVPVGNTLRTLLFVQDGATSYQLTGITVDGSSITAIGWIAQLPQAGPRNSIATYEINITQSAPGVFLVY